MKNIYLKIGILTTCAMFVVASGTTNPTGNGTGGTGNGGNGGGGASTYETVNSTADITSILSGSAQQDKNGAALKLVAVTGSLKHDTKASTINNGDYELTDADGPDANNIVSDGTSTLTYKGNFTGDYKFANSYVQSHTVDLIVHDLTGIVGIATKTADMPTTNNAAYTGEAEAIVITTTGGFDLKSGVSNVAADFGTGKASVTLNGFTSTNQKTGNAGAAPIDEIKITDIAISGNGFTGGTFTTSNAGAAVDLVDTNATNQSINNFFGLNTAGDAPAEVGGHVLMQGDGGIVSATYLAK